MAGGLGQIFTPLFWGRWAVREFGLLEPWLQGASVLDPTMGDGALLEALILEGLASGRAAADLPVQNLYGVEIDGTLIAFFRRRIGAAYGLKLPEKNLIAEDFLFLARGELPACSILFGNPPWSTFADLPGTYKEPLKEKFLLYGLVKSRRDALLGRSRADIAGLVAAKALAEHLRPRGKAVFFLPLSLFSPGGANGGFPEGRAGEAVFSVERMVDLTEKKVFPGVATRYGAVLLQRDGPGSPGLGRDSLPGLPADWEPIPISPESRARQGLNTAGANDIFIFDEKTSTGDGGCLVSNPVRREVLLPEKLLYPLTTAKNFQEEEPVPRKWVFLPYRRDGKPLSPQELQEEPQAAAYLQTLRPRLEARKGVFIRSMMRGGVFWALLGVGPYSFGEWKILWEAYGRSSWQPRIFPGRWQANQALQGSMSFSRLEDCREVFRRLSQPEVEAYLRSFGTQGRMNWAQPGKVQKLLFL